MINNWIFNKRVTAIRLSVVEKAGQNEQKVSAPGDFYDSNGNEVIEA